MGLAPILPAQGWFTPSPGVFSPMARAHIEVMPDGHYLAYNGYDIIRYDEHGDLVGTIVADSVDPTSFIDDFIVTQEGNIAILNPKGLVLVDTAGHFIWKAAVDTGLPLIGPVSDISSTYYCDVAQDSDGSFLVIGTAEQDGAAPDVVLFSMRVSPSGVTLGTRVLRTGLSWLNICYSLGQQPTADKDWMLAVRHYYNPFAYDSLRIIRLDSDAVTTKGDYLTNFSVSGDSFVHVISSIMLPGGDMLSCGYMETGTYGVGGDTIPCVTRTSETGVPLERHFFPSLSNYLLFDLELDTLGDLVLAGGKFNDPGGTNPGLLMKVDTTSYSVIWSRIVPLVVPLSSTLVMAVEVEPDNFIAAAGGANSSFAMFRTDDAGSVGAKLQGYVYADLDSNCVQGPGEDPLSGWRIELYGVTEPDTFVTIADPSGAFTLLPDTGLYMMRVFPLGSTWRIPTCSSDYMPVDLGMVGTVVDMTIPRSPLLPCPEMYVDLSTPVLQVCQPSTYSVLYCNVGALASSATLEIEFDTALTITGASVPFTSLPGNKISVAVGTLAPGACDTFEVYTILDCVGLLIGETHCATATIKPDAFCLPPSPLWDGSSIQLTGRCDADSVRFILENVGTAAMTTGQPLIIVEDDILRLMDTITLGLGGKDSLAFDRNGSTWACLVEQVPFHPGVSYPTAFQEGCTDIPGVFSVGYATSVPPDDGNLFIDIDCQENLPPPVFRTKDALPAGWMAEHFINEDYLLEYHIRFQNLGPDSVFSMYIADTLPQEVDLSSLELGSSTFPYDASISNESGKHILTFRMDRIALPDSLDDWEGSWGYVKFRIKPLPGLPPLTLIENRATVVMHNRQPGVTNVYHHTIGGSRETDYMIIDWVDSPSAPAVARIVAYPNPSEGRVHFDLGPNALPEVSYAIQDLSGKVLLSQSFEWVQSLTVDHPTLPPGTYLFRITTQGNLMGSGKLVVVR